MKKSILTLALGLFGCTQMPKEFIPVKGFEVRRYLGTWYEIARLDHSFEKGLTRVTAEYSLNTDGTLRVVNRGFDSTRNRWKQAEGRAKFVSNPGEGRLKVSFFGPFYGGYNVLDLDADYTRVLIAGNDRSYLWILARQPHLPDAILAPLIQKAKSLGFDTEKLTYVPQPDSVGGTGIQ